MGAPRDILPFSLSDLKFLNLSPGDIHLRAKKHFSIEQSELSLDRSVWF